jgi:hypothetical protein
MRQLINKHNDIVTTLRQKLTEINREGEGRPAWKLENRTAAINEAKKASLSLAADLNIMTAQKRNITQDVFNETRKGGAKIKPAPSEKLYWLQQVQAAFNGRTPEQAIELYSYQLSKMTPDERLAWRYMFDDGLELATYGDPVLEFKAAQIINQNRTIEEKSALKAMQEAERFQDYAPTIKAIFQANLDEAIDGEKQASDPAEVFDTISNDIAAELAKV